MAEEIGELDLTAQANAAQTATNYISADSTGIRIANSNPSTATTYQHQTATKTEFVVEGVSRAEISGDGARFGKEYVEGATDNESYMELDYHSLQMIDKSRNTYFYVSDLRDSSGQATINERHVADGTATNYTLACNATDTNYNVSVSDGSGGTITKESYRVVFSTPPTNGAIITVVYNTRDGKAKAFTFGQRTSNGIIGPLSFSEGYYTESSGFCSHSEGIASVANNKYAHAEGNETRASGIESHSEGYKTTASGDISHAEGANTTASGDISHAEGANTTASGKHSHAEGTRTTASGYPSHAEGEDTTASGNNSHAEGDGTTASETCAHAEGYSTTASGRYSHAEGSSTVASGSYSHAEGCGPTTASGIYSHAQNLGTIAAKFAQTTIGMYNVEDTSTTGVHPSGNSNAGKYALIIGNGTGAGARSNALAVGWDGTVTTARDILITSTSEMSSVITAGSGITIDIFKFCQRSNVASILLRAKKSTVTAANTAISVGTIVADRRPPFECAGPGTSGVGDCWVDETGAVKFRSTSQIAASANFYVRITYPVV